ncbi:MAG: V-type ATP synthase subunit D [Planctomycetes bacterium]|nr:V-type ATP synthase subunit D [Planctomycetota bacterium]
MEQVSANRMELLARKAQIQLAIQGAELLKQKREALLKEFLATARSLVSIEEDLVKKFQTATFGLTMAKAIDGAQQLRSAAMATRRSIDIEVYEQNLWGTKVPEVKRPHMVRNPLERGYALTGVSSRIDETAGDFEAILDLIMDVAPSHVKVRRLGEEIRRTSRRVNALQERLIPALHEQIWFIQNTLEQREREDVFRRKRIKNRQR